MPRIWLQRWIHLTPWIQAKPRSYTLHFSDRTVLHTDHGIFNLTQNVEFLFACYKRKKKTAQIGDWQWDEHTNRYLHPWILVGGQVAVRDVETLYRSSTGYSAKVITLVMSCCYHLSIKHRSSPACNPTNLNGSCRNIQQPRCWRGCRSELCWCCRQQQ